MSEQREGFRWVHVHNKDELEAFYRTILPAVIAAARSCGYAIGVHGSLRRDLDLLAVPWGEVHAKPDLLAKILHDAACGLSQPVYQWEKKPCGRVATSFPVCWTEWNEPNLGHIDLSVMPSSTPPEALPHHESAAHWKDNHDAQVRLKHKAEERFRGLLAYIDALYVSGNDVPVTTTLFSKASWDIIKEMLGESLPLDYHTVEAEAVYRRKLAAYGDETRATSPLAALRATLSPLLEKNHG